MPGGYLLGVTRSARTLVQLEAALACVRTTVPDLPVEIGGRGMGAYLRLVGEAPPPTLTEQLHHLVDQLPEVTPGTPPPELDSITLGTNAPVQLGFYPWVPLLPGRLRARWTAQAAVEHVTDFLDLRLSPGGWPGGGRDVRTRLRHGRIDVALVDTTTGQSLVLPSLPLAPFRRDRLL